MGLKQYWQSSNMGLKQYWQASNMGLKQYWQASKQYGSLNNMDNQASNMGLKQYGQSSKQYGSQTILAIKQAIWVSNNIGNQASNMGLKQYGQSSKQYGSQTIMHLACSTHTAACTSNVSKVYGCQIKWVHRICSVLRNSILLLNLCFNN